MIHNETDEQRERRLHMNRQNSANRLRNESDEERQRPLDAYGQNYVLRRNERQQELHDLQNTRDEYLSNGWRTADQRLHQQ